MLKCYSIEFNVEHPVIKRLRFNGVEVSPRMALLAAIELAQKTKCKNIEFESIREICPVHFVPKYPVNCEKELLNYLKKEVL